MTLSWTNPMWQRLSLRARINLLLALVLALGLAVNIARLVLEAGPRVQAEDQSVIRLAREFIDTIVAGLNEAPDPEARLNQIVDGLKRLRHVSITRQGAAAGGSADIDRSDNADDTRSPPAWFVALVHPEKTAVNVPISIRGRPGSLLITSIQNSDTPVVMAITFTFSVLVVIFNVVADVMYGVLDPRIRYD